MDDDLELFFDAEPDLFGATDDLAGSAGDTDDVFASAAEPVFGVGEPPSLGFDFGDWFL